MRMRGCADTFRMQIARKSETVKSIIKKKRPPAATHTYICKWAVDITPRPHRPHPDTSRTIFSLFISSGYYTVGTQQLRIVDLVILIYGASPFLNQIKYKNRNQILYTLLNGSKNTRYYTDGTQQQWIVDLVTFIYGDSPISNQKKNYKNRNQICTRYCVNWFLNKRLSRYESCYLLKK